MRKRIWIPGVILLAICCALLFWRSILNRQKTIAHENGAKVQTNQSPTANEFQTATQQIHADITHSPISVTSPTAQMTALERSNALHQEVLKEWQVPIEFYGKVVDENSNAVAGARIDFHWVETPDEAGNRNSTTESDADGLFSLQGAHGPSLAVSVRKQGYYAAHRGEQGFKYGMFGDPPFSADPRSPVIFQLRRKGGGAELITSDNGMQMKVNVRIPKDGTPIRVDLLEKKTSPAGQMEISQKKPPWKDATEWSFRLSILDGGFIENEEEFPFEAPETNYSRIVEYRFRKGDANWTTYANKQFYVEFGQPRKYGWLRIESNLDQETVFLTYAINPSGSRNLEPAN